MVKVITSNILFERETWAQRRELLVEGLAAQQADLIGLQEVMLPEDKRYVSKLNLIGIT